MKPQYPREWLSATIRDIAFVKGGKRLPKGDEFSAHQTSFPYVRVTDFKNFGVRLTDIKYLTPETRESIKHYTISANDIYISIAGTIGLTGRVPLLLHGQTLLRMQQRLLSRLVMLMRVLLCFISHQICRKRKSNPKQSKTHNQNWR